MAVSDINIEVKNAAIVGAIEIMISPAYGDSFLREVAGATFPKESLTDEILASVGEALDAKLMELGTLLFAELDEPHREQYCDIFSK